MLEDISGKKYIYLHYPSINPRYKFVGGGKTIIIKIYKKYECNKYLRNAFD